MNGNTCDCGCCAGIHGETPSTLDNRPGLSKISYRIGTHATFQESMQVRLSSIDFPALARLTTRDHSDFAIAFCDASATLLDVLSFYQERIANENFLRTATERRSILELAQLIGYRLAPGVAASTHLAFTLQEALGLAPEPVPIPAGTRAQSVPGPDEQAQTFETVEPIVAHPEWSSIPAQTTSPWQPANGDLDLYLAGVATGLAPGDAILIVGQEREQFLGSEQWDVRVLSAVEPDAGRGRTRIAWFEGLGSVSPPSSPAAKAPKVYVFRQRASLFGHNAPDPRLLTVQSGSGLTFLIDNPNATNRQWKSFVINPASIELDGSFSKITSGSWFALVSNQAGIGYPSLPGYIELYRATQVAIRSRAAYGLSGKVTALTPDIAENLTTTRYSLRDTLVLAQSEQLETAARPLGYPLYGARFSLASLQAVTRGQWLAVSGKRQRIVIADRAPNLTITLDDGSSIALHPGDSLPLEAAPEQITGGVSSALSPEAFAAALAVSTPLRLRLRDRDDRTGTLDVQSQFIRQEPAKDADAVLSEIARVDAAADAVTQDRDTTTLTLNAALRYVYDRETVRINANVARATHGESVQETIGSGNASQPDQAFPLRQFPLTYISAKTPSGRASTLELRVNDLLWHETPTLFEQPPTGHVYTLLNDDAGRTTVQFGDGVEGARLPSGQENVRALYRKGLGAAGNVGAGKISNLLIRPLGVSGVTNPATASGGQDGEAGDRARENAPRTVLTLDRAVSVQDYEDYARSFAGIAKAQATWLAAGPGRGIFLSISGDAGAAVLPSDDLYSNLLNSLRQFGDPLLPLRIVTYRPASFRLRASLRIAADARADLVTKACRDALSTAFGFAQRSFGQMVSVDEVMAVLHRVNGVAAVNVLELYRTDEGASPLMKPRLFARLPEASLTALPNAAELLLLDAGSIVLERMS